MPEFKFKLGEMVVCKIAIEECMNAARMGELIMPNVFTVTLRMTNECSAGTQLEYGCSRNGAVSKFHELELVNSREYDVAAHFDLYLEWISKRRIEK